MLWPHNALAKFEALLEHSFSISGAAQAFGHRRHAHQRVRVMRTKHSGRQAMHLRGEGQKVPVASARHRDGTSLCISAAREQCP
jgi:hypothetical protein